MSSDAFMCLCRPEDRREVEALRLEVMRRLGVLDTNATYAAACLSLAFDFGADIDVGADMWFGVGASSPEHSAYAQCDNIVDGVFYCWKSFADKFPTKGTVAVMPLSLLASLPLDDAAAVSAKLLAEDEQAERAREEHSCTEECKSTRKMCEEGRRLWDRELEAYRALSRRWDRDCDVEFYYRERQ